MERSSATMILVYDMKVGGFVCLFDYGNRPPWGLAERVKERLWR